LNEDEIREAAESVDKPNLSSAELRQITEDYSRDWDLGTDAHPATSRAAPTRAAACAAATSVAGADRLVARRGCVTRCCATVTRVSNPCAVCENAATCRAAKSSLQRFLAARTGWKPVSLWRNSS